MSLDGQAEPRHESGAFVYRLAGLTAAVGLAFAVWPLLDSMNPSADAGVRVVWVDMTRIEPGTRKTVYWGSWPVFIAHRTPEEIAAARADDDREMRFPEKDSDRVLRDEWLVVTGVDEAGWLLRGQQPDELRGEWGGWRSCCEFRVYDLSGRLRTNWGQRNLIIPPYHFVGDKWLVIGDTS